VFVPIAFLPSTAGRLFREFGFVLALAVAISSFVALSLVPAMASRLPATQAPAGFFARLQALGDSLVDAYARLLAVVLRYPVRVLSLAALLALAAGSL
jgi:hydrophobic/amphiphilic exporter-1 (mainly G- bacteria), HAE1 family